ncbi:hypothetical protein BDV97DRAFT_423894 [Delphinella strobiligena]|nr:hypothetical protein BDV97DRAFT_423894 [Delphinella strobiligena]
MEEDAATGVTVFDRDSSRKSKVVMAGGSVITSLLSSEDEERYEDAASDLEDTPSREEDVPKRIKKEPLSDDSSDEGEKVEDKVDEDEPEDARTSSSVSSSSNQSHRTVLSPDLEMGKRLQGKVHDYADDENGGEVGRQSHRQNQSKDSTPDQESDVDHDPEDGTDPRREEVDDSFHSHTHKMNGYRSQRKNQDQSRNHGRKPDEDITRPNHRRDRPIYTGRVLSPPFPSSSTFQRPNKGKNRATTSQPEAEKPPSQPRRKRKDDNDENDASADPAESLIIYRVKHQSALEEIERLKQDMDVANQLKRRAYERLEMEMAESKIANDEVAELRARHKMGIQELQTLSGEVEAVREENKRLRDLRGGFGSQVGESEGLQKGTRSGAGESHQLGKEKENDLLMKKEKVGEEEDLGRPEEERITALERELEKEKQRRRMLRDEMRSLIDRHVNGADKLLGPSVRGSRES